MRPARRRYLVGARSVLPHALAVVLVLAGGAGCARGDDAAPTASDDAAEEADPGAGDGPEVRRVEPSQAERVGSVVPQEPRAVRLPGTGFLDVLPVGTRADGLLDVPPDVDVLGWWDGGSRVGDPFGSVLLAGHVDSEDEGLGPSAELLTAERGDPVLVRTKDRTASYEVVSRELVPLDDLGSYPRVLSSRGPGRLTLVTCAPPFVAASGGYQNLAVVTASPSGGAAR